MTELDFSNKMAAERPKIKSSKPLMEKRRRARINDSLMQLKTLVLDALNKNNSRHSKLEKADILEMTVRYLRTIQRQQISASATSDPSVLGQYRSGYAQCMNEVTHYLGSNGSASDAAPELRTRLLGHLANMVSPGQQQQQQVQRTTAPLNVQQQSPMTFQIAPTNLHQQQFSQTIEGANIINSVVAPQVQVITHVQQQTSPAAVPVRIAPAPEGARTERSFTTSELNGQTSTVQPISAQVMQSVPVGAPSMPSATLSNGEITVVLPPEALPNGQLPTHFIPVYAPNSTASILSPTHKSNIPTSSNAPCHVQLSSPRAASVAPAMSPTGPQSSLTIPAQHAQVTHAQTQVAYCVPVQTQLMAPPVRDHNMQHHQIEPVAVREQILATDGHCVAKSDPMWRPW